MRFPRNTGRVYVPGAVRTVLLAAFVLALATGCSDSGGTKDVSISLRITVWPRGVDGGPPVRWRLTCNPLTGNLPHGDRACYELAVLDHPFAPVPEDATCTDVYGGPQVARVRGRLRGRKVNALLRRTNGCESARWDRVDFLFPDST
jgi:Subtilisin inhibitor-like